MTDWFFCGTSAQREHLQKLIELIPCIGMLSSLALGGGVLAALIAMIILWYRAEKRRKPDVNAFTTLLGWASGAALPLVFVAGWYLIAQHQQSIGLRSQTALGNVCHVLDMEAEKLKLEREKLDVEKQKLAVEREKLACGTCDGKRAKSRP